jgi:hypothetical protein
MVYEGIHCRLEIGRLAGDAVLVKLTGWDVGEFGDAPLRELDKALGETPIALFTDAAAFDAEKNGVRPHLAK